MSDGPGTENRCNVCGMSKENDFLVFRKNIEGTEINLCGKCGIEYQVGWRPEHSPIEPNVGQFVLEKLWEKMRKMRDSKPDSLSYENK